MRWLWSMASFVGALFGSFAITILAFWRCLKKRNKASQRQKMLEWLTMVRKLTWQGFFESNMRATNGKPLDRPYGSNSAIFSWDKVIFNPVYLSKMPVNDFTTVNTEVVLGPKAHKPLKIKIPILIGGMAYGSGYSAQAKIALAKGTALAGTAANTGNGAFLEAERKYADKLIIQYTRGFWSKSEAILQQADMIEIALGHSARGSAPVRVNGKKLTPDIARRYGTLPGLDILMAARLPEVQSIKDWKALIGRLKDVSGGVPISVKFGASHYIEEEMGIFIEGGADVLAFDGVEGGTHGGMQVFMDDTGLPIFPALCRAANFIREQGLTGKVSLAVGGGLLNPGNFSKCLALGADAVFIGTITALVQAHTQTTKVLPWEPPTGLLYSDSKEKDKYDPDLGGTHMYYYLLSCVREMQLLACSLGKQSLAELERDDLVALDPLFAQIAGLQYLLR